MNSPSGLCLVSTQHLLILGVQAAQHRQVAFRAVRYDDIYWMDEIKSLLFHIMFYRLFHGVAKYIVYGNHFSSFG